MMDWGGYGTSWWGMGAGLLILVLLIGLAVWVVWRVTSTRPASGSMPSGETAEDVLRRRFAAGEVDAEEFERRKAVLRKH